MVICAAFPNDNMNVRLGLSLNGGCVLYARPYVCTVLFQTVYEVYTRMKE